MLEGRGKVVECQRGAAEGMVVVWTHELEKHTAVHHKDNRRELFDREKEGNF